MTQKLKHQTACLASLLTIAPLALAQGFIEDGKASLEMRNFYLNRDFRQEKAPQSKAEEWAQGFIARYESGFTAGTIGVGLDAIAEQGIKLDSSRDRRGTGLLPFGKRNLEPADNYSELGLTAKLRVSQNTLRLGTLQPTLPVAIYNDTRLLPSTFSGGMLTSQELKGLTLNAGRLTEVNLRDSSNRDDIGYGAATSDHFDFAGGTYTVTPNLALTYYYGELQDIYRQQYVGLVHTLPLGEKLSLRTDLRYFDSDTDGRGKAGKIDNRNFNGMVSLSVGTHRFSATYQQLSGDSAFPFLNGGDPYVVNLSTFNTFTRAELDSWQLRYDYDFAPLGLPGLTFMTRYIDGQNAVTKTTNDGREWERDTDIAYVVQGGPLKGFNLRWRNVTFRSSNGLTTDLDENRLILGYTFKI